MTLDTKLEYIHTIDALKASASLGRIKEIGRASCRERV